MATNLFENYAVDFLNITDSINKKINQQLPTLSAEAKKTLIRAIEREMEEAEEIYQSMELELNSLSASLRNQLQPRLRGYKIDYEKMKSEMRRIANVPSDRDMLLAGNSSSNFENDAAVADQRARLLAGTSRLNDASKRLKDSHRIALETEEIGAQTLMTLRNQREQLTHAGETVFNKSNISLMMLQRILIEI